MATWQHLRSSTANKRPTTSLADGRIAINTNTASPGLFFKDSAGTGIVKVGPVHVGTTAPNSVPASGGSSGNYTGEQWLDTSVSPAQMKVWNGSTWVGIVADELPVSKLQDGAPRQLIQTDAAGTGVEWTSNVDVPGTLDVTGASTLDSTLSVAGVATFATGSAGSPSLTFTGDANSGVYSPGADQVAISTNGTGRLFVDASGRVGVGSTPSHALQIGNGTATGDYFARIFSNAGDVYIGQSANTLFGQATNTAAFAVQAASYPFGIGTTTAYPLIFGTNNQERARLDSSGRLGLGTSTPQTRLQLDGSGAYTQSLRINDNSGANKYIDYGFDGTAPYFFTPASYYAFNVASAERMRLTATGLGIGTTSPSNKLTVVGDQQSVIVKSGTNEYNEFGVWTGTSDGSKAQIKVETSLVSIGTRTNTNLAFNISDAEKARIDTSGRLLVGTSSSRNVGSSGATLLQLESTSYRFLSTVQNSNDAFGSQLYLGKSRGTAVGSSTAVQSGDEIGYLGFAAADGTDVESVCAAISAVIDGTPGANDMPGRLVFSTTADGASSPTERMRIDNGGQVLINTTSRIANSNASLHVYRNTGSTIVAQQADPASDTVSVWNSSPSGNNVFLAFYTEATITSRGSITYNRGSAVVAYNTTSDYRSKTILGHIENPGAVIDSFKVYRGLMKDATIERPMMIAHEAQEVAPYCVTGEKDAVDDDGNPIYQQMDHQVLVPLLIAEIQQLRARVAALEGV